MERRALIIYCGHLGGKEDDRLVGPPYDNGYYRLFLQNKIGGNWNENEILSLENPSSALVLKKVKEFLNGADYTFVIFTGHGFINSENGRQYIELANESISISNLKTTAIRQTLIIDACRGYYDPREEVVKSFSEQYKNFVGGTGSTRKIFDDAVLKADEGLTVLYAASENQTALDTGNGAAYLLSLLKITEEWEEDNQMDSVLTLRDAHDYAINYLSENFDTIQIPKMNGEKRMRHFPFAVKFGFING